MLRRVCLVSALALLTAAAGCSSNTDEEATREGDVRASETWSGSVRLTGTVTIYAGATVTLDPGTKVVCGPNTSIIVAGTLRKTAGARAKLSCAKWIGVIVAKGGTLDVEGIDIENADRAIEVTKEAAGATVTDAALLSSTRPFTVLAGSKLSLTNVKATARADQSENPAGEGSKIFGSLVASRLDYDADANEGLWLDEGGEAVIEDSVLKGRNGLDLVSARNAKNLVLRYSTLNGAHCGPHIEGIQSFEIDHVTSEDNTFGITIYGADDGVVRHSNLAGISAWLDLQGDHGPLEISNVFTQGSEIIERTAPPPITKASARIPDARPR